MNLFRKAMLAVTTMLLALVAIVIPANKATNVEAAAPTVLYLTPNSNWKVDNARFAAYFFGNGDTWVSMTDTDGDGIYEVSVPTTKTYPSVIFCRMNPANTTNSWNTKWNQTDDLTIPTNGNNHYTVKEGTWDKGGGTWSLFGTGNVTYGQDVLGVIGNFETCNWGDDVDLVYNEETERYEAEIEFEVGNQWKVRYDNKWDNSFGGYHSNLDSSVEKYCTTGSDNLVIKVAGKYLVWVDNNTKLGMEPIWKLEAKVGYQVGTKDDASALRLVAELNLDAEKLETFESTIQWKVTFNEKADTRDVTSLFSSVNPMNGEETLTGAYYAVLTYVNVPTGDYTVELLIDGVAVASITATVA